MSPMKRPLLITFLATAGISGSFAAETEKEVLMAVGQKNFMICNACHGPDGQGLKIGNQLMAPPYTGSKVVLGDPELLGLILLKGIKKSDSAYLGLMAPLEASLASDEALAGVMTYIRNSFGNSASIVTVEEAAAIRASLKGAEAPTNAQIAELTE